MSTTINNTIIADPQVLLLITAKFRCQLGIERLLTQKLASATKLSKAYKEFQKYHRASGICTQRKLSTYQHAQMVHEQIVGHEA